MDDAPKALIEEFHTALLRKRVGQIAIAVVLAEAAWRFVNSLVWLVITPVLGRMLEGHTESVLFESAMKNPFPGERLIGAVLEFALTLILAFYLNRWIHKKPEEARRSKRPR